MSAERFIEMNLLIFNQKTNWIVQKQFFAIIIQFLNYILHIGKISQINLAWIYKNLVVNWQILCEVFENLLETSYESNFVFINLLLMLSESLKKLAKFQVGKINGVILHIINSSWRSATIWNFFSWLFLSNLLSISI